MSSAADTREHIARVRQLLTKCAADILERAALHDQSKLCTPEKEVFDEFTPKLARSTFGSEEYKGFLTAMKPALDHHYACNRHHPEHSKLWKCPKCGHIENEADGPRSDAKVRSCLQCSSAALSEGKSLREAAAHLTEPYIGIEGMTLVDLVEMFFDWKAASERHRTGNVLKSIEINAERFNIGDQLKAILINTVQELR